MLICNFFGAPCSGKSVTRARLFAELKILGVECEEVVEVVKDYVWEERHVAIRCQPYIFGKMLRNIERLDGKVDVVLCDSPLILSYFYGVKYAPQYSTLLYQGMIDEFKRMNNLNFFIEPVGTYNPNGRLQTAEEAKEIGDDMKKMLTDHQITYRVTHANQIEKMREAVLQSIPTKAQI